MQLRSCHTGVLKGTAHRHRQWREDRSGRQTTMRGEAMATAQAFVFDAYGTLFDVHSVVNALRAVTPRRRR